MDHPEQNLFSGGNGCEGAWENRIIQWPAALTLTAGSKISQRQNSPAAMERSGIAVRCNELFASSFYISMNYTTSTFKVFPNA